MNTERSLHKRTATLIRNATRLMSMGNLTTAHPCAVRVRETLQDHHVVSRVKTAFAYVLEVQSNRMLRDRESVALFMENIQDDVQDLESAVTGAQSELENHATRYFAFWRTADVDSALWRIRGAVTRLDEHMQRLREVSAMVLLAEPQKED